MRRPTLSLFIFLACLLLAATGLQYYQESKQVEPPTHLPLRQALPLAPSGWEGRDLPLADTEETKNAVESILQFDDYFSRSYRKGAMEVTLYVAYWRPDRMPPRIVGRHTPDRCWILNGWNCEFRQSAVPLVGTSGPLKPAETGIFAFKNQARLHVLFWHLVGGRAYAYGPEAQNIVVLAPIKDLLTFGLNQRKEQFFIRLACNVPFEQVWSDPGFKVLLSKLEILGLAESSGAH